jgi:hypothetical protein
MGTHSNMKANIHERGFPLTASHIKQLIPTIIRDGELPDIYSSRAMYEQIEVSIDANLAKYFNDGGEELGMLITMEIRNYFLRAQDQHPSWRK